jgi:hypothetical protein
MKKTPEQLEQERLFFEYIKNYEYITEQGRLDLERFCCDLSTCFFLDGIPELSPQPREVYNLLIKCLDEFDDLNTQKNWVQFQNLTDWTPEWAGIYPDKVRTYIHVAGLIHAHHFWIYHIGHTLLEIPESKTNRKDYGWVNEEWTYVHTLIDGWHNTFHEFQKDTDRKSIDEKGFSAFEAFHKSRAEGIDYDQAVDSLKNRHTHHGEGIQRINLAIENGFYLEAITLEECIISNYLNNFLAAKKANLSSPSFSKLLTKIQANKHLSDDAHITLFNEIDEWRKQRNIAIHGFITARESDSDASLASFISFAKATAATGADYVLKVQQWYNDECVDYMDHRFPSQKDHPIS